MKKLIILTALGSLLAAGCATRENRGGAEDNQINPDTGTGYSRTNMNSSPNSATSPNTSGNGANQNNNGTTPDSTDQTTPNANNPTTGPNNQNP